MERRIVDAEIVLVPYYPNYEVVLEWYQDPELCKQVDNIDESKKIYLKATERK